MIHNKLYGIAICMLISGAASKAQDRIYYTDGKIVERKVTEITGEDIKATVLNNPEITFTTKRSGVLFVFNSYGNFLSISKLNEANNAQQLIDHFLNPTSGSPSIMDKLITVQNKIIEGNILSEDENSVLINVEGKQEKMAKQEITLAIYANGAHKLNADLDKVSKALHAVQEKYDEIVYAAPKPILSFTSSVELQNLDTIVIQKASSENNSYTKNEPITLSSSLFSADDNKDNDKINNIKKDADLDAATYNEYSIKALDKTKNLSQYIQVICEKSSDIDDVNKAIKGALELFVNEEVWVEISSKNSQQIRKLKIRDYLNHLKLLNYNKVEIDWVNIQYVSQLHKAADNNYYGTIAFEQQFKGLKSNNIMYTDITRKNVEVMLKSMPLVNDGKTISTYDVLLSNIGVVETK